MKYIKSPYAWLVILVCLLPVPLITPNLYIDHLISIIMINILLAVGLNVVKGFAGQVTVGHIALYAIGAYSSALLSINFGFPFVLAFLCAIFITAIAGLIVAIPSFKLEGAYLALATLGFAESVRIMISVTDYFGTTLGIGNIPAPNLFGFHLDNPKKYYYLLMPITLLGIYFSFNILNSSLGRGFKAVRDDSLAAATSGIPVRSYKSLAFLISAVYAGAAGSLYAHLEPGYIHPNNFTIIEMITLLLMVILGGVGNIWGGIIGAIIVTIFYDLTREYYQYQLLIFGLGIVFTVLFMPKGIGGLISGYVSKRQFINIRKQAAQADTASNPDNTKS